MVVVVFAYTQIASKFIMNQARDQLIESGQIVSKQIEMQLKYDYTKYEDVILSYIEQTLDPVTELNANPEQLKVLGQSYTYFGEMM